MLEWPHRSPLIALAKYQSFFVFFSLFFLCSLRIRLFLFQHRRAWAEVTADLCYANRMYRSRWARTEGAAAWRWSFFFGGRNILYYIYTFIIVLKLAVSSVSAPASLSSVSSVPCELCGSLSRILVGYGAFFSLANWIDLFCWPIKETKGLMGLLGGIEVFRLAFWSS